MVETVTPSSSPALADAVSTEIASAPAPAAAGLPPLKTREKGIFATGEIVEGVVMHSLSQFLLFYLTAVCGLPGSLAGLALFITLMGDAVLDPVMGYWSDNTRTRFGRRHPFMLAAVVPVALGIGLLFSAPALPDIVLFVYVIAALGLLRIGHSTFMLPFAALGTEISRDYKERSQIGAYRHGANTLTLAVVVFMGYSVFMRGPDGLLDKAAYAGFGWACALLAVIGALVCIRGTYGLRQRMHADVPTERFKFSRFGRELSEVARNRSFRSLFLTCLIFWISIGMSIQLGLHAGRYFWGLPTEVLQLLPLAQAVGLVAGIPLAALLLQRGVEKHWVCAWGIALCCLALFVNPVLFILKVIPQDGVGLYSVLCTGRFLVGVSFSTAVITFIAMVSDATDEHELLYGSRREALYAAGITFSAKAAIAFGGLFGGLALDLVGFPSDIAAGAEVPATAALRLGIVEGPVAAALAAISAVVLMGYKLNARRFEDIQAELARRKASAR